MLLICTHSTAQAPYFGSCPQKGLVTGYSSFSYNTANTQVDSYTFLQYAFNDHLAGGIHLATYGKDVICGPEIRGGYNVNQYFAFSLHAIPSFYLTDKFRFSDACFGLYMEGAIMPEHQLFWLTNTYGTIYHDASATWWQYWYLGSYIPLGGMRSLIPMVGYLHSWRFEQNPDIALGMIYIYGKWTFMAWCNEITSCHPYISAGIGFEI